MAARKHESLSQAGKDSRHFQVGNSMREFSSSREDARALREALISENLPAVQYIAQSIHRRLPRHVVFEDLYSAGIVGLVDAVDKFVTGRNAQFRSYAQFRIRGAILDSLRETDWGTRRQRRKTRDIQHAVSSLKEKLERDPTDEEIATELGIALDSFHKIMCELRGLELEWFRSSEVAFLPGRREDDPLSQCLRSEMRTWLTDAVASLSESEQRILRLYYYEDVKMREIAHSLGVTESRVSQIRGAAVSHLRVQLSAFRPRC